MKNKGETPVLYTDDGIQYLDRVDIPTERLNSVLREQLQKHFKKYDLLSAIGTSVLSVASLVLSLFSESWSLKTNLIVSIACIIVGVGCLLYPAIHQRCKDYVEEAVRDIDFLIFGTQKYETEPSKWRGDYKDKLKQDKIQKGIDIERIDTTLRIL